MHQRLFFILVLLISQTALAKRIQIIHTNDLHSFLGGTRTGKGGYARLKTKIDELRHWAEMQRIESVHLDAGDFGEGSSYFLADEGVTTLKALDALGVDVSVIGNHDYILGSQVLAKQIKRSGLQTKLLSANLKFKKRLGLKGLVENTTDLKLNGLKVRVIGLTTDEVHYQYPLRPYGYLTSPHNVGVRLAKRAKKKDKADYVIALTHIGYERDLKLAQKTKSIDLIIGGHSHTTLKEIKYQKNRNNKMVPVVQTGAHGVNVGELIIDLLPNGKSKVISYNLYPITEEIPEDPELKKVTEEAFILREKYFNRSWNEPIGESEIILTGYIDGVSNKKATCWGEHMAKMVYEKTKADVGIHISHFEGEAIKPGVITFGDMIDNFPHFRKFGDEGWQVATSRTNGFVLKKLLRELFKRQTQFGINFYGIIMPSSGNIESPYDITEYMIENAKINGKKIVNTKFYYLAYPSELPFGVKKIAPYLMDIVFTRSELTKHFYWPLIEDYIKANSPIKCIAVPGTQPDQV